MEMVCLTAVAVLTAVCIRRKSEFAGTAQGSSRARVESITENQFTVHHGTLCAEDAVGAHFQCGASCHFHRALHGAARREADACPVLHHQRGTCTTAQRTGAKRCICLKPQRTFLQPTPPEKALSRAMERVPLPCFSIPPVPVIVPPPSAKV